MPHHIHPGQLDGEHTNILASSSENNSIKKLVSTLTVQTHRFHIEEFFHYHVYHNGSIVHSSNKLQLAIKVYNQIDTKQPSEKAGIEPLKVKSGYVGDNTSICVKCDRQDHCNRYLRCSDAPVKQCASFKELI